MRPAEEIKKMFAQSRVTVDETVNERILDVALKDLSQLKQKSSAQPKPNAWRIIMKSRMTKFATAAVIIIAVLLGINYFGDSIDGTSVALGETIRAMKEMPWVHMIAEIDTIEQKGQMDSWISFSPYIMVLKRPDGTILYADLSEEVKYDYNLLNNTITISPVPDLSKTMGPKSHFDLLENMIEDLETDGAEIFREESLLDGKLVEIIRSVSDKQEVRIVRDTERNLLISAEHQIFANGPMQGTMTMEIEYPQQGPMDIYAVGAPKDADIVDLRPKGSTKDLIKEIQRRFNEGFGDYLAVVLESSSSREAPNKPDQPAYVIVMRHSGELWRVDRYMAIDPSRFKHYKFGTLYEAIKDIWANPTIEQILESEDEEALEWQMLFDGRYSISRNQIRGEVHKNKWRGDSSKISNELLPAIVWTNPYMLTIGNKNEKKIFESLEVDPNHSHLVGFRVRTTAKDKSKDSGQGNRSQETTDDYWFDPAKDYILVEHLRQKHVGQKVRYTSWPSITIEAGQASNDKWYPKIIRIGLYSRTKEKRIFIDTNPTFKQGIFEESSLLE